MIYVTADTHADLDRFKVKAIKRLKKNDTLIVLGDFGFLWDGSKAEKKALKWLDKRRYNLLFIDGAHENFDLLKEYPTDFYMGGKVHTLGKKVHHLQRGEIYNIEGKRILCFGGGESADRESRAEGKTWWRCELPDSEEIENCYNNLKKYDNQVDYILTHEAPGKLLTFINLRKNESALLDKTNRLQSLFDIIMAKTQYSRWLFGCHHLDLDIGAKATAVYKNVVTVNPDEHVKKRK